MKGVIQPNHVPKNNYDLLIIGLPEIVFTEIGDIEEVIDVVDLPDRTRASGGTKQPGDFSVIVPSHHDVDIAAMEAFFLEAQEPVAPTYKKAGVYSKKALDGTNVRQYALVGLFCSMRTLTTVNLENEGEMDAVEYLLNFDDIKPIR